LISKFFNLQNNNLFHEDQTLTNDQLELLAYFCTIVKISYLSGALCLIPKLNQLIGIFFFSSTSLNFDGKLKN